MLDPISSRLFAGAGARGPVAIMYHSMQTGGGTPDWRWAVSQRRFDAQLDLLAAGGWHTATLAQLADPAALPARTVVITFDDGYRDNLAAFESLARRGMTASWFIVTRDIGAESAWGDTGVVPRPMLDRGQLREMHQAGMDIGAHTRSHPQLTQLDDAALRDEVAGSRQALRDVLGAEVSSFAYPYGDHDERVVTAVREAGYAAACVTRSGWGRVDGDPLRIRRLAVFAQDGLATFARKLAFADNQAGWSQVGDYYLSRLRARIAA